VFAAVSHNILQELVLVSKWSCDASTGHGEYKQKARENLRDSDMFISSFVLSRPKYFGRQCDINDIQL
jgi:hypothetical protein